MTEANGAIPQGQAKRPELLVSIHDVGPRFEAQVDRLTDVLAAILGGPRFAMLVVPDHWGEAPLAAAPAFCRRLRDWSDAGVEMFAHGWFHRDQAEHAGFARLKAGTMTAGEGEFLGLDRATAARRMADGKALIEEITGREAAGFVAPAWLYGPGSRAALPASGFRLAEDHMRVWRPATGETLARGPVVTWASRSRPRQLSSLAAAAFGRLAWRLLPVVRIAVHPGDTGVPALMDSIQRTISAFAARRVAGRYADLLPPSSRS
jgi:predicted deacetylase